MICLTTAALLLASPAAAREVHESAPLAPDGALTVELHCGAVNVAGWDQPRVEVAAGLEARVRALIVDGGERRLRVEVDAPTRGDRNCADLHIKAPRAAELGVTVVAAGVQVIHWDGPAEVAAVTGDLRLRGASPRATLAAVSGDVRVELTSAAEVEVGTVSGDIDVVGLKGGRVEIESVSGDLQVEAASLSRLEASSVSGDLSFAGGLAPDGRVDVELHSGDVTLALTGPLNARLEVETFSGSVRGDYGARDSGGLEVVAGEGRGRVEISTFSGDVKITGR